MDGGGSSSGDVSSTAADEVPLSLSDPELLQPNASPPTYPTENDVAFLQFVRTLSRLMASGGPNTDTGRSDIFPDTRGGEGGGNLRHADAGSDDDHDDDDDDDDAYGGFGFSFGAVPATGVAMACLPETTVGVGEGEGEGEARESGECAVCLEKYEAGDELRTMPCAHSFHERCIFEWLRASRLCPLCRFPLPAEEGTEAEADVVDGTYEDDEGEADDGGSDGALESLR